MRGGGTLVTGETQSPAEAALVRADIADFHELEADARRALIRASVGAATCLLAPVGLFFAGARILLEELSRLTGLPGLFGWLMGLAFFLLPLLSVPMLFVVGKRWTAYADAVADTQEKLRYLELASGVAD